MHTVTLMSKHTLVRYMSFLVRFETPGNDLYEGHFGKYVAWSFFLRVSDRLTNSFMFGIINLNSYLSSMSGHKFHDNVMQTRNMLP